MSVVGGAAVASRGVGVNGGEGMTAREIDERDRMASWAASPRSETRVLFTCIMFLTRIPCPGWCDHHPAYLILAMAWFPAVGAVIGLVSACVFDAARPLLATPLAAAAVAYAADLFLTSCFHLDGVGDAFDGIGGGWSQAEILRIMKDSRLGTYGTAGIVSLMLAKTHVLADLGSTRSSWAPFASTGAGPAIVVAHTLARATAAPLVYSFPYVVDEDDAKGDFYAWFGRSRDLLTPLRVFLSSASGFCIAVVIVGVQGALVAGGVTVGAVLVAGAYGQAMLGGVQGDFLGGTICMCEVAIYLVFAACTAVLPPGEPVRLPLERILAADPWPVLRLALLVLALYNVSRFMGTAKR
jgi:adenosylcobinamide-GDP ribazoletransferase